jgi:hypothetical protein
MHADEEHEDDIDAAIRVGSKVIEAAERVLAADRIVPGAAAVWPFEMDDVRFEVTVKVAR